MNVHPDGRARVTAECLQIHHKPCDAFNEPAPTYRRGIEA